MSHSIGIELDHSASEPLFVQLYDQLLARIESGAFPNGFRLPPTRTLAATVGAHRNTVVRAYDELHAVGVVKSVVGRGTLVDSNNEHVVASPGPIGTRFESKLVPLEWGGLLSESARAEPLIRAARLPRLRPARGVGDVVDLTRMHPPEDLIPAKDFQRCIEHVLRTRGSKALGYAPAPGLLDLREQLVADLARQGVPASADDIVITSGSQQAIDLVARALCDPGDGFAVEAETYHGAINILAVARARLISVPSSGQGPSLDALEASATRAKGLYLMPNCHNPTGVTVPLAHRRRLLAWSHRHGVPIIEDDYGADLELGDTPPPPAMRALDPDVVYMSTFSKRLIPALRIGFVVCPKGLRDAIIRLKQAVDLGTSGLLQHALAEFLDRGYLKAHLRRSLPVYRSRRDALEAAFERFLPDDVQWHRMERGLVTWLGLPPTIRADELFVEAQRQGVLVTPGSLNSVSGALQSGVRVTLCNENEPRLAEGVRRLAKALKTVRRQARPRGHSPIGTI